MKDCGNCKWFCPERPKDWTPRPHYGEHWDKMQLVVWLEDGGRVITSHGWPGDCRVGPIPAQVRSNYLCASWCVDDRTWGMLLSINDLMRSRAQHGEIENLRKALRDEQKRSRERFRKLRELRSLAATNVT